MDIEDAALMYEGWGDDLLYEQQIARKMTAIISDVVNKSFGGKGAFKAVMSGWKLPTDEKKSTDVLVSKLEKLTVGWRQKDLVTKHKKLGLHKGVNNGKR